MKKKLRAIDNKMRIFKRFIGGGAPIGDFEELPSDGGYVLFLRLTKTIAVHIGKKGRFLFKEGLYIYIGRAGRGLPARLRRHYKRRKTARWHIDYLTRLFSVRIEEVLIFPVRRNASVKSYALF